MDKILPIHQAQLLTYMKLADISIGLLINFNVKYLKNGIKRMVCSPFGFFVVRKSEITPRSWQNKMEGA